MANFTINSAELVIQEAFSLNDYSFGHLLLPDGKFLVYGRFTAANGFTRYKIARFNADMTIDPSFQPEAYNYLSDPQSAIYGAVLDTDGNYIIMTTMITANSQNVVIYKISSNGAWMANLGVVVLSPGFDMNLKPAATFMGKCTENGYLSIRINGGDGGTSTFTYNGGTSTYMNIIDYSGALYRTTNAFSFVRYVVNEGEQSYNQTTDGKLWKMDKDADTVVLQGFVSSDSSVAMNVIQVQNSKYYIGGMFTSYNGTNSRRLIAINISDALVAQTYNIDYISTPGSPGQDSIIDFYIMNDGRFVVGGYFNVNGTSRYDLFVANSDGTLDNSFTLGLPTLLPFVTRMIKLQDDKYVILAGNKSYLLNI